MNGNIIQEGESRYFEWDAGDNLRAFYIKAGDSVTKYARYLYDSGGSRVKKLVKTGTNNYTATTYIDGVFEYTKKVTPSETKEQSIIHILDGSSRIATLRQGDDLGDTTAAIKYCHEDHLGNGSLYSDENGVLVNREEYYPFGGTSFGSYAKKKYRYNGKEKDEESGLYYYGARYYATWMCRFYSTDPKAAEYANQSSYCYAANNPIMMQDVNGEGPKEKGTPNKTTANMQTLEYRVDRDGPYKSASESMQTADYRVERDGPYKSGKEAMQELSGGGNPKSNPTRGYFESHAKSNSQSSNIQKSLFLGGGLIVESGVTAELATAAAETAAINGGSAATAEVVSTETAATVGASFLAPILTVLLVLKPVTCGSEDSPPVMPYIPELENLPKTDPKTEVDPDNPVPIPDSDDDDNRVLYRGMTSNESGSRPLKGESARKLGVRPNVDIPIDENGYVHPRTGGMSVAPDSPTNLPAHRRPPKYGGKGKDPVWGVRNKSLPPGLVFRQDSPTHGVIEPAVSMSYKSYKALIEFTAFYWRRK